MPTALHHSAFEALQLDDDDETANPEADEDSLSGGDLERADKGETEAERAVRIGLREVSHHPPQRRHFHHR